MTEPGGEQTSACSSGDTPVYDQATTRVGYLLSRYPARSHTFLLQEVLGLRSRGFEIEVASINPPDRAVEDLSSEERAEARRTFYVKSGSRVRAAFQIARTAFTHPAVLARGLRLIAQLDALSIRQRAFWCFYLGEALLVGRWMRRLRLTHLHVHFGGAVASVGMLTAAAWRIPYSLTIHGPEELLRPAEYTLNAKVSRAAFVICISNFCREQVAALLPLQEQAKLATVRLGVHVDRLTPSPAPRDAREPLRLVCVGRLVAEKGHIILLQALVRLHEQGLHFRTVLVGAGPEFPKLEQYVAEHALQGAVTFTAGLSHAETLQQVRQADIFVLASFAEGVPVALMEAMSLGVPCVSTRIAGIPELIQSDRNGVLVEPGDAAALADALERLAGDPALRQRFAEAGRSRVISAYDLAANLDELAALLHSKLGAARSAHAAPAGTLLQAAASENS